MPVIVAIIVQCSVVIVALVNQDIVKGSLTLTILPADPMNTH